VGEFFDLWPAVVAAKTVELAPEIALQAAFSETATQSAFWALASRQQRMEDMLTTANGQLQVLEWHTESFLPSKLNIAHKGLGQMK